MFGTSCRQEICLSGEDSVTGVYSDDSIAGSGKGLPVRVWRLDPLGEPPAPSIVAPHLKLPSKKRRAKPHEFYLRKC